MYRVIAKPVLSESSDLVLFVLESWEGRSFFSAHSASVFISVKGFSFQGGRSQHHLHNGQPGRRPTWQGTVWFWSLLL